LVAECGLLVTADTMALHAGLGTGVPTVALFGPTSAVEIEPSGPLLKIVSPKTCANYYARECDEQPCCMEEISASLVFDRIREQGWLDKLTGATDSDVTSPQPSP
jgi:ADP-heptose:LPS heptosyltransferase